MPQDQGDDLGNTKDQPNVEEASKHDWFKKPERPPTPDRNWNAGKQIDFRPPQTWIGKMAKARKPPTTFDELISTPIDFSEYVLHNLKIKNLTQEHLVGPAFNLLKGTCKSRMELEFHFEDFYGYASNKKSKHVVFSTKRIIAVTRFKVVKKYDYGYLDEIIVPRKDQSLHKFVEGDFPKFNLRDIEDMLLLLVHKKLSNLERGDLFDLNKALQMFTRRVVILKPVDYLQLGVEINQKKLNVTRPETFRDLYDALVKSYQLDKDLFYFYGKAYSLKKGREDKDKDEDPPAGPDQEEPVFETADTKMPQDQGDDLGNTKDQPNVEEASKHDWFKKPERPPTPDRNWNAGKQIDFRPPQTWIGKMAKARKPPTTFDELI
nr:hypothetical protein [Tanacetum cinerariifolium]